MYSIRLPRRAREALDRLPTRDAQRGRAAIDRLADDPRPPSCVKLTGDEAWRIRVGDYRVVYAIDASGWANDLITTDGARFCRLA